MAANSTTPNTTEYTDGDERLVDLLAASLSEHLAAQPPPPPTTTTTNIAAAPLLDQARRELCRRRGATSEKHGENEQEMLLQQALTKASQQCDDLKKSSSSTSIQQKPAAAASSFSLLFSGNGGSLLASDSFITWKKVVEEAETIQEKLAMLQNVEYLEDLLPDWQDSVCPFLKAGLQQQKEKDIAIRFVNLHRAWFHKTRGVGENNVEYRSLQIDLVQNLVDTVNGWKQESGGESSSVSGSIQQQQQQQQAHNEELTKLCVCNCLDMFEDWVDRTGFFDRGDARMYDIGSAIWQWSCCRDDDGNDNETVIRHSPCAAWFTKWVTYMSTDQVLTLVSTTADGDSSTTMLLLLFRRLVETMDELKQQGQQEQKTTGASSISDLGYVRALFSLSVLRSILTCTRVSRFPWSSLAVVSLEQKLGNDTTSVSTETADHVKLHLLELYVQFAKTSLLLSTQNDSGTHHRRMTLQMCVDAIDTILWGCQNTASAENNNSSSNNNETLNQQMLAKVRSLLVHAETLKKQRECCPESEIVLELLNTMLGRLDQSGRIHEE